MQKISKAKSGNQGGGKGVARASASAGHASANVGAGGGGLPHDVIREVYVHRPGVPLADVKRELCALRVSSCSLALGLGLPEFVGSPLLRGVVL